MVKCHRLLTFVALLSVATSAQSTEAQPSQAMFTPSSRQAVFEAWQRAHRDQEDRIADVKARTDELIESYVPYMPALTYPAIQDATIKTNMRLDADPVVWRVPGTLEVWDDVSAPRMRVIPAGEFTMGSAPSEVGHERYEQPRHRVRIAYPLAVSLYPVTVMEYDMFVAETGYKVTSYLFTFVEDKLELTYEYNWQNPGFTQGHGSPVVGLNWDDAVAYVAWLSTRTGKRYRLLSEAEYEYAARAATTTAYWWGDDAGQACKYTNAADRTAKAYKDFRAWRINDCTDGYVHTAPVTTLKANDFGLFGMTGNAWSWVLDCWNDSYWNAPADGSPNLGGNCGGRALRGGSWADRPEHLRSSSRGWNYLQTHFAVNGFRVAREL